MPLLDKICNLARARNHEELDRMMLEEKFCIDVQEGLDRPIILLAREGNHQAVTFLIKKFNASLDYAVYGYAQSCHAEQVNDLLHQGAHLNWAVLGYAQSGNKALVDEISARGADLNWAVLGYAQSGNKAQVDQLLAQGADKNFAIILETAVDHSPAALTPPEI